MTTGRAHRKHGPRRDLTQSPEELAYVGGDIEVPGPNPRDIRGGRVHQVQKVLPDPATPAVPVTRSPYRGMMAHGVPPEGEHWERPQPEDPRARSRVQHEKVVQPPAPVPVYIVEQPNAHRQVSTEFNRIILPVVTAPEPVRIASIDPDRARLLILNEDSTNNARIGKLSDLVTTQAGNTVSGVKLPAGMTSYLKFEGHDELFGISGTSATVQISVIIETYVEPLK